MNIEKVKKICKDERCIIKTKIVKDGEHVASTIGTGTAQYFMGDGFPELSASELADVFGIPEEKESEYFLANRMSESNIFYDSVYPGKEEAVFEEPLRLCEERVWSIFRSERGNTYFAETNCLKPFEKEELDIRYFAYIDGASKYLRVFCGFYLIAVILLDSVPKEINRICREIARIDVMGVSEEDEDDE